MPGGSQGPPSIGGSGGGGGGGGRGGGGGGEFMLVLQDAAKPGSLVKKGDAVAEFDRQYMLLRLEDYNSSVLQTEASFKQLEANLDVSKKAHTQTIEVAKADLDKALLEMKTLPVLSAMDAERRRLALEEAQARYKQLQQEVKFVDIGLKADRRVAELQIKQSKLELQRAEANANRMLMKAPIDGLVVMQNVFRGSEFDQIKVGDQVYPGQMFMQIVDPSSMVINATVSQVDVGRLRIGQRARVRFDAFPDLELPAHIYSVGSVGKPSRSRPDWVKELGVALRLDKMDPRVIPDLSVSCDVILEESEADAIVPREAVFSDTGRDGKISKPYVLVQGPKGAWSRREVELGVENFTHVIVKSGLKAGEVISLEVPAEANVDKKQSAYSGWARRAGRET
ncbi:MAG: HlyD family efflux transporter periplasmic adaptor subunit [Bryobacterales bacterium]|nr:HlyD family efflux transporter periplasmic adaptor subunit [Bryobacterales bacterium]